jgi:hypothetical protein
VQVTNRHTHCTILTIALHSTILLMLMLVSLLAKLSCQQPCIHVILLQP